MKKPIFIFSISLIFIGLTTLIGCQKEDNSKEPDTLEISLAPGCNLNYGVHGFVVQNDGIINFRDAKMLSAFLKSKPRLNNGEFKAWETSIGAKTAFGLSIDVEDKLGVLLTRHEKDPKMTEAKFRPIFEQFVRQYGHLAKITTEGVEPLFSSPFCYIANKDGVYRICGQEYRVKGTLLFSYPVGKQDLVTTWNGESGEFGELRVQSLKSESSNQIIQLRDESLELECTAVFNNNKRIIIRRESEAKWVNANPNFHTYNYFHQAMVKAQTRTLGIWWRDTRHIALQVTGTVTNRHIHPQINWSHTNYIDLFYCIHTDRITVTFAVEDLEHPVYSLLNDFENSLSTSGTNRKDDCLTIQATCTLLE